MKKFNNYDIIHSPKITEKATSLSEYNKIVFKVHKGANKKAIKRSIEKIFKVDVIKVNTLISRGKSKIVRGKIVNKPSSKKAVVTLKKGQSIDLSTGI